MIKTICNKCGDTGKISHSCRVPFCTGQLESQKAEGDITDKTKMIDEIIVKIKENVLASSDDEDSDEFSNELIEMLKKIRKGLSRLK